MTAPAKARHDEFDAEPFEDLADGTPATLTLTAVHSYADERVWWSYKLHSDYSPWQATLGMIPSREQAERTARKIAADHGFRIEKIVLHDLTRRLLEALSEPVGDQAHAGSPFVRTDNSGRVNGCDSHWYRGVVRYGGGPPDGYIVATTPTVSIAHVWGESPPHEDPEADGFWIERRPTDCWERLPDAEPEARGAEADKSAGRLRVNDAGACYGPGAFWYHGVAQYEGGPPRGYLASTRETAAVKHVWSGYEHLRDDAEADRRWIERRPMDCWQRLPNAPRSEWVMRERPDGSSHRRALVRCEMCEWRGFRRISVPEELEWCAAPCPNGHAVVREARNIDAGRGAGRGRNENEPPVRGRAALARGPRGRGMRLTRSEASHLPVLAAVFEALDGQTFCTHQDLADAVRAGLQTRVGELPTSYHWSDAIATAERQGWLQLSNDRLTVTVTRRR